MSAQLKRKVSGAEISVRAFQREDIVPLTDLVEEQSAVFHAHIWHEENRGVGVGIYSSLFRMAGLDFCAAGHAL